MSTLSTFIKRLRDIMRNDAGVNGDAQRIEQIAWMLFLKVYDSKERTGSWTRTIISPSCPTTVAGATGPTTTAPGACLPATRCWISSTTACSRR